MKKVMMMIIRIILMIMITFPYKYYYIDIFYDQKELVRGAPMICE